VEEGMMVLERRGDGVLCCAGGDDGRGVLGWLRCFVVEEKKMAGVRRSDGGAPAGNRH